MANNFCRNCGTPLAMIDGKYKCPNCGTEYAVDWGQEDVARAEQETEQERNQAQLDRDLTLSQTRAQIARQQQYNERQRQRRKGYQIFENMFVRLAVILGGFFLLYVLFFVGLRVFSKSIKSTNLLGGTKSNTTQQTQVKSGVIDGKEILKDEDFLETAYDANLYAVKYLVKQEAKLRDPERILTYTGHARYEEAFLVYRFSRTELVMVFALDFSSEDGNEEKTLYVPVTIIVAGVDTDGKIYSDYEPDVYYGYAGLHGGFEDMDTLMSECLSYGDDVKSEPFTMPEKILSGAKQE